MCAVHVLFTDPASPDDFCFPFRPAYGTEIFLLLDSVCLPERQPLRFLNRYRKETYKG